MPGPVFREGRQVELRTVEEEDLDFLQRIHNDPTVRAGIGHTEPTTGADQQEWFESISEDDHVQLLVCVDGEAAGVIGFQIDHEVWGSAEVWYTLAPEAWNNGYTTDALWELAGYAFDQRRLHKLTGRAYETNPASQRVLEKVGFQREGTFRREAYVDGEYVDVLRYGLLEGEFESRP